MQVKAFVLGGMSYGGPHSSAIVAAVPERVMGWFLLAPVVSGQADLWFWSGCRAGSGVIGLWASSCWCRPGECGW